MKTARRHELQTNQLADWLGEAIKSVEQYSRAIIAAVLAIVVIGFLYRYMTWQSSVREEKVWDSYYSAYDSGGPKAMADVADKFPDTLPGRWARLSQADTEVAQGTSELFQDKAKATESLQKAVDHYQSLRKSAREQALQERVTLGLARAYESQGKLEQSRDEYKQLLSKWPNSVYASVAQSRLADLERDSTKQFYDWFARQEKKPPLLGDPGIPGHKPPFDLNSLPTEPPDFGSSIKFGEPKMGDAKAGDTKKPADDGVPVAPRD